MKKLLFLICLFCSVFTICAESNTSFTVVQNSANSNAKYILYPTTNMWAFLKLDTSTGIVTQVHFSVGDDNRAEVNLNPYSLLGYDETPTNGRFALYPTQNMFNFILLDTKSQVHWDHNDLILLHLHDFLSPFQPPHLAMLFLRFQHIRHLQ